VKPKKKKKQIQGGGAIGSLPVDIKEKDSNDNSSGKAVEKKEKKTRTFYFKKWKVMPLIRKTSHPDEETRDRGQRFF